MFSVETLPNMGGIVQPQHKTYKKSFKLIAMIFINSLLRGFSTLPPKSHFVLDGFPMCIVNSFNNATLELKQTPADLSIDLFALQIKFSSI